ncbi:hypothetical protein [Caenibius sp. WL]|uniref:hypothetical protein n=1 Tax=Caenibius sp. WL TaxID=2872646 RepID=UPI001C999CFB|nr:hypothetical protein [Caenibius sp. WL]
MNGQSIRNAVWGKGGAMPLAGAGAAGADWRPGLRPSCHNEIFASAADGGGVAAAMALALDGLRAMAEAPGMNRNERPTVGLQSVLWVQDREAMRLSGRPYWPGLPRAMRGHVIHVAAETPADALFALEEGVRCRDLACVIGELAGNPRALTFTASRRLSLMAERHGVPLYLIRLDAVRDLGSARMRWHIRSAPSRLARWDERAPGQSEWRAELFRARGYKPGEWNLRDDGQSLAAGRAIPADQPDIPPHSGDLVDTVGDRTLAAF